MFCYNRYGDIMNTMEKFNYNLNESLYTNHKQMAQFRRVIDNILQTNLNELGKLNKVVIIGAGKMREFSLSFLLSNSSSVRIIDIDKTTVNKTVDSLNLSKEERNRITVSGVDVTGFEKIQFFDELVSLFNKKLTYEMIDAFLSRKLDSITHYHFLDESEYDLIYVSPIYTQLVYHQLLMTCAHIRQTNPKEHLIKYLEQNMLDYMPTIINRFNDDIVSALSPKGRLVVLSDIFEFEPETDFANNVSRALKNNTMETLYQTYLSTYGMGLGDYGLYYLDQHLNHSFEQWLIWPFSDNKQYVVKLKTYKHN